MARFPSLSMRGLLMARRFGVPASMVAKATRRRLAGDWQGACSAAATDTDIDLANVRRRHGTQVAAAVELDLMHLAPDLLRWHAPREPADPRGALHAGRAPVLAVYEGRAALRVLTPGRHWSAPRLRLTVQDIPSRPDERTDDDDWTGARYLWDARAAHLLLHRAGGGDRTPFFRRDGRPMSHPGEADGPVALSERVLMLQDAGRITEAWRAAGVQVDDAFGEPETPIYGGAEPGPETLRAAVPALAAAAQALLQDGAPEVTLDSPRPWWYRTGVFLAIVDGQLRAERRRTPDSPADRVPVPRVGWERLPDVELLRTGLITAEELHPLVRAALFPEQPDPGYRPRLPTVDDSDFLVRCRGVWHRVGWAAGHITAPDHAPEELARERVMRGLGGGTRGCASVTDIWLGHARGRPPRRLRDLRTHAMAAVDHGNTGELLRILDAGVDPAGLRDRERRGLLHLLHKVDFETLLPRLLAAGLDVNRPDAQGVPPLGSVLLGGGSTRLVRALITAGAVALLATTLSWHRSKIEDVLRQTDSDGQ